MHEAYEVVSLLKLTEQIESIAAYDDNLLVATRQGHLMMYLVTPTNDISKFKIQVLRYHKTFSKKPIQQIEVIPAYHLLLCLSDNILVLHDIKIIHFPVVQTMLDTKGATLFALSNETHTSMTGEKADFIRLAIAVKRKIQFYFLKNGEFITMCKNITVSDIPKEMSWGQNVICIGFKDEYTLYSLDGNAKGQFLTSSARSMEPCITKISETSFLLGRDQSSVIISELSPTTPSENIMKVNEPITAAAFDDPYALGLISDQVTIHTIEPPMFIQTLSDLNRVRLLYKCRQGLLYAASISHVWRIGAVDITKQRQVLLKDKHFQLALKLTDMSEESDEEKKQKTDSIQMLYAFNLFDNKNYREAMKKFLQLNTNPSEVIKLFPELCTDTTKEDSDDLDLTTKNNPYLEDSLLALIEYLRAVRLKENISTEKNESTIKQNKAMLETIDTALLKCYLQTNDVFIGPLLRLNNCKLEEAEQVLLKHRKYSELIILYQTNNRHTKALQFMKDQAKEPDSVLKGFDRTKNYLQQLGSDHMNLIFEFSNWVLTEHPEEGLKIFTDDFVEVEKFPRPKVVDFLLREHQALVIPYLEHIIHVWKDENTVFHNALVRMLRDKILDKKETCTDEQRERLRVKLLSFLEKSNHYSPEQVLVHFPTDSLMEERAVVLGKLDAHEQALSIYIYILGDVQRAIQYCDTVYEREPDNKKNQDIYIILIKLLINPTQELLLSGPLRNVPRSPDKSEPDIDTAIKLLEKHANKIDPIKALAVLPDSIPISRIRTFLEIAIQKQLINRRKMQVLKGLQYADNLQVQELKMIHQSQSVIIADYNVCPVCKKRFGNQSAFVRYPNGDIVHYSCHDKKSTL